MKFVLKNPDILGHALAAIAQLPVDGTHYVEVGEHKKKRSLDANAYYHVVIQDIARHIGYTPEETKCITKFALGYFHEIQGKESILLVYDQTHKMSVQDMGDIIEQTIQWGAEKGVQFSQPDFHVEFGL